MPTIAELADSVERSIGHRSWHRMLSRSMVMTDTAVIVIALVAAQFARFGRDGFFALAPATGINYTTLSAAIGVVWLISLSATNSRGHRNIGVGVIEYQRVLNATLMTFGALAVVAFLLDIDIARGYLAIALPTGLILLMATRVMWRRKLSHWRLDGRATTGAIIVGRKADVDRTLASLQNNPLVGYRPVAVSIVGETGVDTVNHARLPNIDIDDVIEISRRTSTRAVMVAGELPEDGIQVRELGWGLENSGVELILMSRLTDVAGPRIHLRPVGGLPMVHVDLPQYTGFNHTIKRGLDLVVATIAIILLSPVMIASAAAVRLTSEGPAIFRQERVGAHGQRFTLLKFRSMAVDAEARLAELAAQNEGNGILFKLKADPRVTKVGAFLRKYSIDELPQLFNVLRGDMSLVGPRPPLPSEVDQYESHVTRRLLTKPGITGLWQVSGRSNLSWEESVRYDLYYVENWSATGDLVILAKTFRAVLRRDGAY